MKISQAKEKAIALLASHKLAHWKFEFDNSVRRFGVCRRHKQVISLSRKLVELNSEEIVTDTLLHEIAHALAPAYSHHNHEWKRIAREIGCNGERCYGEEVATPPKRYTLECPECKKIIHKDRVRKGVACGSCCKKLNGGKYSEKYMLRVI